MRIDNLTPDLPVQLTALERMNYRYTQIAHSLIDASILQDSIRKFLPEATNNAELIAALDQVTKAKNNIETKITELREMIKNGNRT